MHELTDAHLCVFCFMGSFLLIWDQMWQLFALRRVQGGVAPIPQTGTCFMHEPSGVEVEFFCPCQWLYYKGLRYSDINPFKTTRLYTELYMFIIPLWNPVGALQHLQHLQTVLGWKTSGWQPVQMWTLVNSESTWPLASIVVKSFRSDSGGELCCLYVDDGIMNGIFNKHLTTLIKIVKLNSQIKAAHVNIVSNGSRLVSVPRPPTPPPLRTPVSRYARPD